MLTLQLFGGCALASNGEAITGPAAQRRRLALLALLAASPGASVSRDKLTAYFWPDVDRERARHFLADSVFTLRKALGKELLLTPGDDVRINLDVLDTDVVRYERLVEHGAVSDAVVLYRGPFLDGFFVSDAPEFERWAELERDRLARRHTSCLERMATLDEAAGEWSNAAEWWRQVATHDPYSSRVALRMMQALDAAGDTGGALQHARTHETRVREELGLESDPAVVALADQLRTRPAASVSRWVPTPKPNVAPPILVPSSNGQSDAPSSNGLHRRTSRRVVVTAVVAIAMAAALVLRVRTQDFADEATPAGRTLVASSGNVGERKSAREDARELYTQGRYTLTKGQFDPAIHARALELFQQAATRDPTFAPAYAGMADVYNHADEYERAKRAALHALTLDDSLAEAHTALAYVLAFYEHRWAAADTALLRAIALNPRYVLAHLRRANVLAALGRFEEAMAEVERAREIQPESFVVLLNRGFIAYAAGRPDAAIAHFQAALVLEPGRIDAQHLLATAYWGQERYAEAQAVMRGIGNIAGVVAMSGNRDTMAWLAPLYAGSEASDSISKAAALYARLGRADEAFDQLDRLYERRHRSLGLVLRMQPFLAHREHPRYARLLRMLRLR